MRLRRLGIFGLALCGGCAGAGHTKVLVDDTLGKLPGRVVVEAVNITGRELPVPPPGLIEQAVHVVTQQSEAQTTVADAFVHAAAERLATIGIGAAVPADATAPRLRIRLEQWDLRDGEAAGAVVFVSADYQLVDEGRHVVWEVRQQRQPVRLSGPNLSRYEVARVARTCVDLALASLLGKRPAPDPPLR